MALLGVAQSIGRRPLDVIDDEYVHGAGADYETVMRVFGSVALWGTVAEHEFGWRAERAYPIELVLPAGAFTRRRGASSLQAVESDLAAYGVPLRISDDPAALAVG